jgi:hypothetical protein
VLERAGILAVSICTDAFSASARAMARVLGFPGFEYVAVPHPVASRTEEEIAEMVHAAMPHAAMPQIARILGVEDASVEDARVGDHGAEE